jgi:hypothetical protein
MADAPPYTCWAEHQEDLTAEVEAIVAELKGDKGIPQYGIFRSQSSDEQAVTVTCSAGHDNVFTVAVS